VAVAWKLLLLRWKAHGGSDLETDRALDPDHLEVLKACGGITNPDNTAVLWAVARLGGHLANNGAPGWLTLRRGLEKLAILSEGWSLAKRHAERCDQSCGRGEELRPESSRTSVHYELRPLSSAATCGLLAR
jgi:hypothetical protein